VRDSDHHSASEFAADPADSTSTTLLGQARARNARAWEQLVFVYTPLVRWWCRCHGVRQPQDVDDVTQEVFATVAAKLAEFTEGPAGSFRKWLYTITRHKVGDHHRRSRAQPAAAGGSVGHDRLEELPAATADSSAEGQTVSERAILLRRALEVVRSEFEPRTWEAAWRVTVEGHGSADVAAALGMSAGAVHTARWRVLRRLRELLAGLLDEDPGARSQESGARSQDSGVSPDS
jgi:RNA polymerase sigma-70 factor (ECF subfamily)